MKRILAIILTVVLVLSSVSVVSAEDNVLTLGTAKRVSVTNEDYVMGNVVLTFKPTVTDYYWFTSSNQSDISDPFGRLCTDSECTNSIATGDDFGIGNTNFNFCAKLTAGTTYYLDLCSYGGDGTHSFDVTVTRTLLPTAVSIVEGDTFEAHIGGYYNFSTEMTPNGTSMSDVTWSSDNTSVVTIDSNTGYANFWKVGSATITATTANGLKDTIKVNVGDVTGITISGGDKKGYVGEYFYIMYNLAENDGNVKVTWTPKDSSIMRIDESSCDLGMGWCSGTFTAAGETTLTATTSNGLSDTINISVENVVNATAVSFEKSSYSATIGQYITVNYNTTPTNTLGTGTWTSSDTSVAEICYTEDTYGTGYCYLRALKAGTTTLSLELTNGDGTKLTKTVTITVTEPKNVIITTAQDVSCTINSSDDRVYYKFVPEEDGLYVFEATDDTFNSDATLYNSTMEQIKFDADSGLGLSFALGSYLLKGQTYFLEVSSPSSTGTITISVRKTYYPTAITIEDTTLDDVRIGDQIRMMYTLEPANSYVDLSWSSSDRNVLDFVSDGIFVAYGAGTATISVVATYEVNEYDQRVLTDEIEVTISEPDAIVLNKDTVTSVTTVEDESILYKFTPDATGAYVFYSNCSTDLQAKAYFRDSSMVILEESKERISDNNFAIVANLTAGENCYFEVASEIAGTFNICITAAQEVESFIINNGDVISDYSGYEEKLDFEFTPINSYSSVTFESSDQNVVTVYPDGYITLNNPGTATITATAENGVTDTIKIEVLEPMTMETSVTQNISIKPTKGIWIEYEVSATGSYVLRTENLDTLYWVIWDDNENFVESVSAKFIARDWTAGDKFSIQIFNSNEETVEGALRVDMLGDADGNNIFNPVDKVNMRRSFVGSYSGQLNQYAGDVNGDGRITPTDCSIIARAIAGGFFESLATQFSI